MAEPVQKFLVVARWNEQDTWLDQVPDDWTVFVVQKGEHLPNTGREATSYLFAACELYDLLGDDDLVVFCQGDPFAHYKMFLEHAFIGDDFHYFGNVLACDGRAEPHDRAPLAERAHEWLGLPADKNYFVFAAGAQLRVTGAMVKSRPKDFYERLYGLVEHDEKGPWIMERLWGYVFNAREEEGIPNF